MTLSHARLIYLSERKDVYNTSNIPGDYIPITRISVDNIQLNKLSQESWINMQNPVHQQSLANSHCPLPHWRLSFLLLFPFRMPLVLILPLLIHSRPPNNRLHPFFHPTQHIPSIPISSHRSFRLLAPIRPLLKPLPAQKLAYAGIGRLLLRRLQRDQFVKILI